jgi:uroporphyrinogen III methyltransferase/synthase
VSGGKVIFVGAGPGMGGELTLTAKEWLEKGEVIVYDALVSPFVLLHAQGEAEMIPMGKRGGRTNPTQEEINEFLVKKAKAGKLVIRLKGGDPGIFGRLKEEISALREEGIPYEIIPGVTAASLCAAVLGIPLTDRDRSSSITFLTGHRRAEGKAPELDWEAASRSGTIVVYMGILEVEKNVQRLLAHGVPPTAPVAVVRWAGTPRQELILTQLKDLPQQAERIHPPALWIVGELVRSARISSIPPRPIVTLFRPERNPEWEETLRKEGFLPFPCPLQKRVPSSGLAEKIKTVLEGIQKDRPCYLAFTSPVAVESFVEAFARENDLRRLNPFIIVAMGEGTARIWKGYGILPELVAEGNAGVEDLVKLLGEVPPGRLVVFQGEGGRWDPFASLLLKGFEVERVITHRMEPLPSFPEPLRHALRGRWIQVAIWTSPSQVRIGLKEEVQSLWEGVRMIAFGRETERALREHGVIPRTLPVSTLDALIRTLQEERITLPLLPEEAVP